MATAESNVRHATGDDLLSEELMPWPNDADQRESHPRRLPALSAIRESLREHPIVVMGLSLLGLMAFGLSGFLGFPLYPQEAQGIHLIFQEPWLLYLWFCSLVLTLQTLMFLSSKESRQRWQVSTLVVTVVCVVVLGAVYFYDESVSEFLPSQGLGEYIEQSPWTYTVVNFAVLGVFAFDTLRRWYLVLRGRSTTLPSSEHITQASRRNDRGKAEYALQLIAGDLLAGALVTIGFVGVLRPDVVNFFIGLAGGSSINAAVLALPGTGAGDELHTLGHIDGVLFFYLLIVGLFALALAALLASLSNENVAGTLLRSFLAGLWRQLNLSALAHSLRNIIWPTLIGGAVLSLAFAADSIHAYLNALSGNRHLIDLSPVDNALLGRAVLAGIGATLAVVTAASLQMFSWRTEIRWLRDVGKVARGMLVTTWLFALVLSGFNQLLIYTHKSTAVPFPWLSVTTLISFLAFVGYSIAQWLRQSTSAKA